MKTNSFLKIGIVSSSIILFLGLMVPQQTFAASLSGTNIGGSSGSASQQTVGTPAVTATGQPTTVGAQVAAAATSAGSTTPAPGNCGVNIGCYLTNSLLGLLAQIAYWMLTIVGWLLGVVGMLFNWAVVITVFQYAAYFANSTGMLAAWGILRDIGNIIILFGFLFIGIMMILNLDSFDARHSLPRLIIFAVLLNFSLFAGEAIVDVANVLSAQLYLQAGSGTLTNVSTSNPGSSSLSSASNSSVNLGIAGAIIQETGLSTSFAGKPPSGNTSNATQLLVFVGLMIFMAIVMMILLAGAIMLFIRAVMLTILLVISPIAFAGMAVPQLEGRAKEWWEKLISNAFFAPIYLLLIFVGLKVMSASETAIGGTGSTGSNFIGALQNTNANTTGILILFAMMAAFMIAALMFAKSSGAAGAQFATSFATRAVQRTFTTPARLAATPVRAGARYAVGTGSRKVGQFYDDKIGQWRESDNKFKQFTAKGLRFVGADEAVKGTLQKGQDVKFGMNRSFRQNEEYKAGRTTELTHAAERARSQQQFNAGLASKSNPQMERALQNMSQSDIEDLLKKTNSPAAKSAIATLVSADKANKIMDSKDLNAHQKEEFVHARNAAVQKAFDAYKKGEDGATFDTFKEVVQKQSMQDVKLMARYNAGLYAQIVAETNSDPAKFGEGVFKNDVIDKISTDESFTATQRAMAWQTKRSEQLKKAVADSNTAAIDSLMSKMSKDVAELPESAFTRGDDVSKKVINNLSVSMLASIMSKGEMSDTTKTAIMNHIQSRGEGNEQYERVKKYLQAPAQSSWWGKSF